MPFYFLFFLNTINSCLYYLQIAAAGLLIINTRSWASNRFELGTSRENTEINKGVSVSNPYIEKKKWGELLVVRRWGWRKVHGLPKKIRFWSITSTFMAMETGGHFPNKLVSTPSNPNSVERKKERKREKPWTSRKKKFRGRACV